MIGIDITIISRFKGKEQFFAKRILSQDEIRIFKKTKNKTKFIATRWAIKESLYKADNLMSNFSYITIKNKSHRYYVEGYNISTSTEGDTVIAVVTKEK